MFKNVSSTRRLVLGDLAALAVVTLLGFATHNTLGTAGARMLSTFIPLTAAWFLVGGLAGVLDPRSAASPRALWRPVLAMLFAAPLFGVFRAWMLGTSTVTVIFVLVMGGVGAAAMLLWRGAYALWIAPGAERFKTNG